MATASENANVRLGLGLDQDEGVLRDVLDELDRERAKRAELEAQLRKLSFELAAEREQSKVRTTPPTQEQVVSSRSLIAMEAQVRGFRELVDALTLGKPAISAAAAQESASQAERRRRPQTLPLHVVRLLEVMPWDPRAQEHVFGQEVILEWQVLDSRENKWQSSSRFFPPFFKSLPLVKPSTEGQLGVEDHDSKDKSLLYFLAGASDKNMTNPHKHGMLTNEKLTGQFKLDDGYPLPQDGGRWEWIGGWRVDKAVKPFSESLDACPCDEYGWLYAVDAQSLVENSVGEIRNAYSSPNDTKLPVGTSCNFRRRKWIRQRILIDYPMASERTRQYLRALAENARLSVTTAKLSEQLGQTKMALTVTEEKLLEARAALEKQTEFMAGLGIDVVDGLTLPNGAINETSAMQVSLLMNEQAKELGTKITQWYKSARKTSEDLTSVESGEDDMAIASKLSEDSLSQTFPWKKIGRGALIEKLAGPRAGKPRVSRSNEATTPTAGSKESSLHGGA